MSCKQLDLFALLEMYQGPIENEEKCITNRIFCQNIL